MQIFPPYRVKHTYDKSVYLVYSREKITYWFEVRLVELFSRVGSRCCLQFRGVSQSRVQCTTLLTNYKRGTVN